MALSKCGREYTQWSFPRSDTVSEFMGLTFPQLLELAGYKPEQISSTTPTTKSVTPAAQRTAITALAITAVIVVVAGLHYWDRYQEEPRGFKSFFKSGGPAVSIVDWAPSGFRKVMWGYATRLSKVVRVPEKLSPKVAGIMPSLSDEYRAIISINPHYFEALYEHPELTVFQRETKLCDNETLYVIAFLTGDTLNAHPVSQDERAVLKQGMAQLVRKLDEKNCSFLADMIRGKVSMSFEVP